MSISGGSQEIIADLLRERTGQQITASRRWRIETALAGLFRQMGIANIDQLVCCLEDRRQTDLPDRVVEALLNNETYFFRDNAYFETLANTVLPDLAEQRRETRTLNIWSAGCSTGQEALSLAMLLSEQGEKWNGWTIRILGTDVSKKVIAAARSQRYSQFEVQRGISVGRMLTFFEENPGGWSPCDQLRTMVRFDHGNLLDGAPPQAPFDLILCRNVLLYFANSVRASAFDSLRRSIQKDGWLMLGAGETPIGQTSLFAPAIGVSGFYRPGSEAERQRQFTRDAARCVARPGEPVNATFTIN